MCVKVATLMMDILTAQVCIVFLLDTLFCHSHKIAIFDFSNITVKRQLLTLFLITADIDECTNPTLNACHSNATCADTEGSYECECQLGFTGDGIECEGNAAKLHVYLFLI